MPFAHRLLQKAVSGESSIVLGFVPSVVGGTRIWIWAKVEPLYEAAVARARAALAAGGGTLGAVLWFQGENDTIELDDTTAYGGRMERLVNDLQADLGIPDLLVIQVGSPPHFHGVSRTQPRCSTNCSRHTCLACMQRRSSPYRRWGQLPQLPSRAKTPLPPLHE